MKNEPRHNPPPQSNLSAQAGEADASPASSLEEVRKRLQSYGYLNSRIERFYRASLSRSASQFLNRLFLSFRVGMLIGTLAAILMTAGTLIFNVDLLRSKLDLALLFLYFEVFFVLIASGMELALIFLVSIWERFAGPRRLVLAGQVVSFIVGLSFFAYFLNWGRSQYEFLRILSRGDVIAIGVVLTLSCIFVAKCSWLGFLVAFRELQMGSFLPNWKRHGLEVMLALAAVLALLPFLSERTRTPAESTTPLAVLTTTDRWIVIGIDGLSAELFDRFAASGEIPELSAIASESLRGQLEATQPVVPPVAWTTIATGVSPAEHGIAVPEVRRWGGLSSWVRMTPLEIAFHSVLSEAGLGQRQPVSGYMRRVKSFWEILSDSGIASGVANWWGSWPARNQRGWNISERYFYKRASGAPPQNETFPPDLFSKFAAPKGATPSGPLLDEYYSGIFRAQLQASPVRVAALYLPGLDILNFEFYQRASMNPFEYTREYAAQLRRLDSEVGEIRSRNPGARILLILHQGRTLPKDHSAVLIYPFSGQGSAKIARFSDTDIAPLLLHSCGIPIAASMSPALIHALDPSASVRTVASFPKREEIETGHADEFNDLLVEQMKSLGYLQ